MLPAHCSCSVSDCGQVVKELTETRFTSQVLSSPLEASLWFKGIEVKKKNNNTITL